MAELRDLKCPNCGAPLPSEECVCPYCSSRIVREKTEAEDKRRFFANFSTPKGNYGYDFAFGGSGHAAANAQSAATTAVPQRKAASKPLTRKIIAAILAILLGFFGVQYFYLGKIGRGLLCLVFCWTYIPAIVGFFQGIIWLCTSDAEWEKSHKA